jgi:hypothetical protein
VAERSSAGWGLSQCIVNDREDTFEIPINVMIPKTQNLKALLCKYRIAMHIGSCMRIEVVLASIDFNNEPMFKTHEVHHVVLARRLPAEMKSLFSPGAQVNPQFHLLTRHSFAKAARKLVRHVPPPGLPPIKSGVGHPPPSGEGWIAS